VLYIHERFDSFDLFLQKQQLKRERSRESERERARERERERESECVCVCVEERGPWSILEDSWPSCSKESPKILLFEISRFLDPPHTLPVLHSFAYWARGSPSMGSPFCTRFSFAPSSVRVPFHVVAILHALGPSSDSPLNSFSTSICSLV